MTCRLLKRCRTWGLTLVNGVRIKKCIVSWVMPGVSLRTKNWALVLVVLAPLAWIVLSCRWMRLMLVLGLLLKRVVSLVLRLALWLV